MPNTQVNLIQYGLGNVGRALVRQIRAGRERLAARTGLALRHVALADSGGVLQAAEGLDDAALLRALSAKDNGLPLTRLPGAEPRSANSIVPRVNDGPCIVIDVTAADGMEAVALDALPRGWGVALANKRPLTGSLETFRRLTGSGRLRCEATVGAGLPWIEMLAHLLDTGDRILRLEAAVSGTLGYLMSQLEAGVPLSQAVVEARRRGYTEPDPRDDLGASDVRRKALILARLLGQPLEWQDIPAQPLYPPAWDTLDVDGFLARLPELDAEYAGRMRRAKAAGRTLRYGVEVGEGSCTVGLREVPIDSPLGALQGPACLLAFHTGRYSPAPLVISGPGAGAEVTAAGVYADVIALAREQAG